MPGLVFGGLALILGLVILRMLARANPATLARRIRSGGGLIAVALGLLLVLSGRPAGGVPLLMLGVGLLGWGAASSAGARQASSSVSTVRTRFLEMQLDQATGSIRGTILAGTYAGRRLEQLGRAELQLLVAEVDAESLSLLEAYLERRGAGWGADAQGDADGRRNARGPGEMSQEEAYQILGLQPGAGTEDIRRAHRALMMKLHPDQGGSTYLAARVNEAKEVLLRQHG